MVRRVISVMYAACQQVHGLVVFSFLLSLPLYIYIYIYIYLFIYLFISQFLKQQCSSSSYSFHFCHLPYNSIMKEAISSQNMTNLIGFSNTVRTCSLVTFSDHLSSPYSSSTSSESSPNTSDPIFLVSRSLSHIKQCSKHST